MRKLALQPLQPSLLGRLISVGFGAAGVTTSFSLDVAQCLTAGYYAAREVRRAGRWVDTVITRF